MATRAPFLSPVKQAFLVVRPYLQILGQARLRRPLHKLVQDVEVTLPLRSASVQCGAANAMQTSDGRHQKQTRKSERNSGFEKNHPYPYTTRQMLLLLEEKVCPLVGAANATSDTSPR